MEQIQENILDKLDSINQSLVAILNKDANIENDGQQDKGDDFDYSSFSKSYRFKDTSDAIYFQEVFTKDDLVKFGDIYFYHKGVKDGFIKSTYKIFGIDEEIIDFDNFASNEHSFNAYGQIASKVDLKEKQNVTRDLGYVMVNNDGRYPLFGSGYFNKKTKSAGLLKLHHPNNQYIPLKQYARAYVYSKQGNPTPTQLNFDIYLDYQKRVWFRENSTNQSIIDEGVLDFEVFGAFRSNIASARSTSTCQTKVFIVCKKASSISIFSISYDSSFSCERIADIQDAIDVKLVNFLHNNFDDGIGKLAVLKKDESLHLLNPIDKTEQKIDDGVKYMISQYGYSLITKKTDGFYNRFFSIAGKTIGQDSSLHGLGEPIKLDFLSKMDDALMLNGTLYCYKNDDVYMLESMEPTMDGTGAIKIR